MFNLLHAGTYLYCGERVAVGLLEGSPHTPTEILMIEWRMPCGQQAFRVLLRKGSGAVVGIAEVVK